MTTDVKIPEACKAKSQVSREDVLLALEHQIETRTRRRTISGWTTWALLGALALVLWQLAPMATDAFSPQRIAEIWAVAFLLGLLVLLASSCYSQSDKGALDREWLRNRVMEPRKHLQSIRVMLFALLLFTASTLILLAVSGLLAELHWSFRYLLILILVGPAVFSLLALVFCYTRFFVPVAGYPSRIPLAIMTLATGGCAIDVVVLLHARGFMENAENVRSVGLVLALLIILWLLLISPRAREGLTAFENLKYDLLTGRTSEEEALSCMDRTLWGEKISVVLQEDVSKFIDKISSCHERVRHIRQLLPLMEEQIAKGEKPAALIEFLEEGIKRVDSDIEIAAQLAEKLDKRLTSLSKYRKSDPVWHAEIRLIRNSAQDEIANLESEWGTFREEFRKTMESAEKASRGTKTA